MEMKAIREVSLDKVLKDEIRFRKILVGLVVVLLLGIALSLSVGEIRISLDNIIKILLNRETTNLNTKIIMNLRLPRTIFAIIVGAGLGLCGIVMQSSVQNPLADPYILGISSGASFGATFYIFIGVKLLGNINKFGLSVFAFLGGVVAAVLVISLSSVGGKTSSVKLVLAGTVVNALCSAFTNFLIYLGNNAEGLKSITFWTMGNLSITDMKINILPGIVVLLSCIYFLSQSRNLNSMMIGEEAATTLGVDLNKYRKKYIAISVLIIGILVSSAGIIGFVGLVVPHMIRGIVGSNNKKILPLTIIASAIFLLYADILSRLIIPNGELPIGVITSMVGAPLFMYILVTRNRRYGDN